MGLVENISQSIAHGEGTPQRDLPPLYGSLDPEALE